MCARIYLFPARRCVHIYKTFCLYTEQYKLGADATYHCVEVDRLEKMYEEVLEIAEQTLLTASQCSTLWAERSAEIYANPLCPTYKEGKEPLATGTHSTALVDCVHFHEALCLKKVPVCNGRCRYYVHD